ncbi:MAG TPA: carboxypeptidase-like regulatory domain-containing protein, partial [Bryobacteraceae bacterium]|nr:carboxypeptidase-like regulatory domain-containing protein [Bryobacteraceae bacterium]
MTAHRTTNAFPRLLAALAVAALCALSLAPRAAAQSSTAGTVSGSVADPSGAMVPKAEVQLQNIDTNAVQTQVSNDAGGFVFPNVVPGNYSLTVKAAGFRAATVSGLIVEVN